VFARQKEFGITPKDAKLSRHDPDVQEWAKLPADERKLYARMMEVFAGFCEHMDYHVGRTRSRKWPWRGSKPRHGRHALPVFEVRTLFTKRNCGPRTR
jgi:hypothetical protein